MLEFISKLFSRSSKKKEPAQETPAVVQQQAEEKPKEEEPYEFDLNRLCEKIDSTAKTEEERKMEAEEARVNHIKSLAQEFLTRWNLFYANHKNDIHDLLEIADHLEKSKLILVRDSNSISSDTGKLTISLRLTHTCAQHYTYVNIRFNEDSKYSLRFMFDNDKKSKTTCKVHYLGTILNDLYTADEDVESYFNRTEFLSNPYNREGTPSCEAYVKLIKCIENEFDALKKKLCKTVEEAVELHQ